MRSKEKEIIALLYIIGNDQRRKVDAGDKNILKVYRRHCDQNDYRPGFFNLGITDILDSIILCFAGGCPVHCRIFSSIPGVYPVDASSTPSVVTTKMSLHIAKYTQRVEGAK